MAAHDEKPGAHLAKLEKGLTKVVQACRQNIPGWASDLSAIVRVIVGRSPAYDTVKPTARGWVDYVEWFSLMNSRSPAAIRGLGTLWWVDESAKKQTHMPLPLEVEVHRVAPQKHSDALYTLRFHSRGRLTRFYNNGVDEQTYRELLTEHLGDTDARRVFGMSDLMAAVADEDAEAARGLIAAGAVDVNARDAGGNTALSLSALFGNFALTSLLRGKGADARLNNDEGYSALDIARRNRFEEIVELLSAAN